MIKRLVCSLKKLQWKLYVWNIKLFHRDEWLIYPNGRMYNKKQLEDAWDSLNVNNDDVEHPKLNSTCKDIYQEK